MTALVYHIRLVSIDGKGVEHASLPGLKLTTDMLGDPTFDNLLRELQMFCDELRALSGAPKVEAVPPPEESQ